MTLVPTGRQVGLWSIPIVFAVCSIAAPFLIAPMVAFDVALLMVLVADGLASGGRLEATRRVGPVQSVGRPFEVVLEVANRARSGRWIRIIDAPPGEHERTPLEAYVPAGTEVELDYALQVPRRGHHDFGPITLRWRSRLGLWERQRRFEVSNELRVYPDFGQLRDWGLDARLSRDQAPVRARRRTGGENEFQRLRPYVPGDPYRHIDWKATARKNHFITREFGQESNQNVIFLIDAGRMMSADYGKMTAFDHALNAALMMGQVALRHGDRVGLLVFDDKVRAWLPPKGGKRSGARLIRSTYDVFPSLGEPDYALAYRHLAGQVRRRSLVVLFTAVVDDVNADYAENLVRGLSRRHLALSVWLRDPSVDHRLEAPTDQPVDAWKRGAAAEIALQRERQLTKMRRSGALVVDSPADQLTPALLSRYLEIKARRLL